MFPPPSPRRGSHPPPPIQIIVQNVSYSVKFPFPEPYPSQIVMMEKILFALREGTNALLESPTGTGKTLCLLCATLAFAEHEEKQRKQKNKKKNKKKRKDTEKEEKEEKEEDLEEKRTKGAVEEHTGSKEPSKVTIVYVSRTHSQLQQVISELKATEYAPRSSVVGSRKQLCVNEWVAEAAKKMGEGNKRGAEKLCKIACNSGKCDKKRNVGTYMERVFGIDVVNGWFANQWGGEFNGSLGYGRTTNHHDGTKERAGSILSQLPNEELLSSKSSKSGGGGGDGGDDGKVKGSIMDIEDLVKEGKRANGPCPYYLAREMTRGAEIIFAPYSYILDAGVRKRALGDTVMNWHNSIVIFDEAHNAESACEEAASRDLTAVHVANAIKDADAAFQYYSMIEESMEGLSKEEKEDSKKTGTYPTRSAGDYLTLRGIFAALEREIAIVCAQDQERVRKGETLPSSRDGWFIFDLLAKVNINMDTYAQMIEVCEDAANVVSMRAEEIGKGSGAGLERVKDFLDRAFEAKQKGLIECYRSRVGPPEEEFSSTWNKKNDDGRENKRLAKGPTMSFWCMVPGVIVNELCELGVKSLLLASGTLSPMDSFASELRAPFPVRLENPHVIPQENVWAGAFLKGPSNAVSLNSSYRFRDTEQYKNELGLLILRVARVTPDGVLVFFPSYGVMAKCIEFWKTRTSIWNDITRTTKKTLVVEPKESDAFLEAFESFNKALERSKTNSWSKVGLTNTDGSAKDDETAVTLAAKGGAMFFAVCRGKVSEGIDFADKAGRAVILTGIPYAPKASARVRYKREFLDAAIMVHKRNNTHQSCNITSGEQWYSQTAMRATNQAIGRVIRHKDDFGAVILADERFAYRNHQSQLSLWLRPAMQTFDTFERGIESLSAFFERCGNPNSALMLAAAEKSAKKKKRKGPYLQHKSENNETAEADQRQKKNSNTNGEQQQQQQHARRDTNFSKKSRASDTSLPFALMNALNNNNDDNTNKNENEVDDEKERRNFLFSGGGGGGGGGSLASRLLKSGGNRDNTTKLAGVGVGNIRGSGAIGNVNVVDKAMLAKQKLVKRARAELPPEDFPKFVEVMKSAVSADSSDVALHESMKTLAKLCKIEKRGVGPSTLWAAIGTSLALKDAAKKAYDEFEENAKRKMAEKKTTTTTTTATATTIPPLVQSSQPPPPPKPKIDAGVENIFGRLARPPKEDSSAGELKSSVTTKPSSSSQALQKAAKKKTSCDHCKASKCDRPFQSIICGHFACYKCFNAVFAKSSAEAKKAPTSNTNNVINSSSSSSSGPCPTCSTLVTKKSLKKMYLW